MCYRAVSSLTWHLSLTSVELTEGSALIHVWHGQTEVHHQTVCERLERGRPAWEGLLLSAHHSGDPETLPQSPTVGNQPDACVHADEAEADVLRLLLVSVTCPRWACWFRGLGLAVWHGRSLDWVISARATSGASSCFFLQTLFSIGTDPVSLCYKYWCSTSVTWISP